MRPIRDLFYVRADAEQETKHKFASGKEIYISEPIVGSDKTREFSPYERAVQVAEIVYCPMKISSGFINDLELKPGDRIYTHHFVIQPDNYEEIAGEKLYRCTYDNVFCVIRDNNILPIQDFVFLTPVLEPIENFESASGIALKPERGILPNIGEIQIVSIAAAKLGLKKGDHVYWSANSDYSMTVEGKGYWRMRASRIAGKIEKQ